MIQSPAEGLVSPSDIADIAGVSRGAVSNWRKRSDDFPQPIGGSASKPLFSREEVTAWLESRGHAPKKDAGQTDVWAALNLMRDRLTANEAAELVLSLAVARKTGAPAAVVIPHVGSETLARLQATVDQADPAVLADAADFVLERLAKAQGKMGADFGFIGSRTTAMLASLAAARPGGILYDPACGIAAALLEAVDRGAHPEMVVGHDINARALKMAAQRAELRGLAIELAGTDVLSEDVDPSLHADVVILEPPFGVRFDSSGRLTDARFDFGAPPRSSADTAWLQHAIAHLTERGRAYVLTPSGVLFRGGEEGRIRTELVRRGCVEAVIGLPGKMLPHTSIPLALWVLRRPVVSAIGGSILFIDAAETVAPENNAVAWLHDPAARDAVPHTEVSIPDVLAADATLTPQRWVDRTEREPGDITNAYVSGWAAINDIMQSLRNVLASFEHFTNSSRPRVMTVGELVEHGVVDLRPGLPRDRYQDAPKDLRGRIATASDVRDGTLRGSGLEDKHDYPELTKEGDVLATTMNTIRARVDYVGGHLPSTGVYRLRVLDPQVLSPEYLAIALAGSWNDRFQGGTTIQRASIKDLEIPLVPTAYQETIHRTVRSLQLLSELAEHLADEAGIVNAALLDATRYHAPLARPADSGGTSCENRHDDSEGGK